MDYRQVDFGMNNIERQINKKNYPVNFNSPMTSTINFKDCASNHGTLSILVNREKVVRFSNELTSRFFGYEIHEKVELEKLFSQETVAYIDELIDGQNTEAVNSSIFEAMIIDSIEEVKKAYAKISKFSEEDYLICFMIFQSVFFDQSAYINKIGKAISEATFQFANSNISDTDINLKLALESIGKTIGAEHASVFLLTESEKKIKISHEWCGKSITPISLKYREIELDKLYNKIDLLKNNEFVLLDQKDHDFNETDILEKIMFENKIKTSILVPMIYQKQLTGYLCFDFKSNKDWRSVDFYLLKSIGVVFVGYIERFKLFEAIRTKQKEINRSEERYYQLFDNIKSGVIILEPRENSDVFIIKDLNKQAAKIAKCTYIQAINKNLVEIFPSLQGMQLVSQLETVLKTEKPLIWDEFYFEGKFFKGWLDGYIYKLPSGEISMVFNDITEEFETNKALKESRRRLFTLMSNLQGMAYRCLDYQKSSLEFVSHGCEELTGYTSKEMVAPGFSYSDIVFPDDFEKITKRIENSIEDGEHFELVYRIITKDKRVKWVWEKGNFVNMKNGAPILEGFISDINDLILAEEAVYENQEKFKTLFQSTTNAVLLHKINEGGMFENFIEFNDTACKLFGYTYEEMRKMNLADISSIEFRNKLSDIGIKIRKKKHLTMDFDILKNDGSSIYAEISFHHLELKGEELFLSIARDITDRKLAEITINESKNRIKKLHEIALRMEKTKLEEEIYDLIIEASKSILKLEFYTLDIAEGDFLVPKAMSEGLPDTANLPTRIDSGIPGKTFSEGKTIVINNLRKNKNAKPKSMKYQSALSLPIGKHGVFQTASTKINNFSEEDVELLEILLSHATEAINRIKTEEKIKHITFHDSLTGLYNRAFFEEELKRLDVSRQLPFTIIMGDVNGLKLTNDTFGHHEGDLLLKEVAVSFKSSCRAEDVIARWGGDEFIIFLYKTDYEKAERVLKRIKKAFSREKSGPVPISVSFGIATKSDSSVTTEEILRLAEERMYRNKLLESSSTRNAIIASLQKTLLEKSYETEEHTRRMQKLAENFGGFIDLNESTLNELVLLAALHDIGKITIPEEIILKQGELTPNDWKAIKRHPEIGYRIALSSPDLAVVADGILTHHEWWNGEGYPRFLKGVEIPLISRIVSIIDAYDTMTRGRSYKESMSHEEAVEELKRFSGIQFDPDLVGKFIKYSDSDRNRI